MLPSKRTLIASSVLIATLGLTGCGGGGSSSSTPTPTPTNSAPTDIALSNNEVAENAVAAVIGELSATDADTGDTFTYSVSDNRFVVTGNELALGADVSLDFETEATVDVDITVTDSANTTFTKGFTINVADILEAPVSYAYESRFESASSVSYTGQIARQVLIADLFTYIGSQLGEDVKVNQTITSKEQAVAKLMSFYQISDTDYDEVYGDRELHLITNPGADQTSLKQISSSHKDLQGKIAGQDEAGQHKDWSTALVGWNDAGSITPDDLAKRLIEMIGDNVQTYADGNKRFDPFGTEITELYITDDGRDLNQLLQKFLHGAVSFSQATDDYLDDTIDGKGLLSDNTAADGDGTKPYSSLEHQFDEGFGYFGAARNYNDYSDDEVSVKGGRDDWQKYHDTDQSGSIDLTAEFNFGYSTNATKRDRGTVDNTNPTDFSKVIFDAFLMGRAIIVDAGGELNEEHTAALQAQRDIIVLNWEKAIAATVVHYINDTTDDLNAIGTADFSYSDLAKHWSEMKGFALNLQFNPRTPVTEAQFAAIHAHIGMMPVLSNDGIEAYKAALIEARDILQTAYQFDADNVAGW